MGSPFIFFSEYFNWVSLGLALIFYSRFSKSSKWLSVYLVTLPFLVLWMNHDAFQLKNNMYLKHTLAHLEIGVFSLYYYYLIERKIYRKLIQLLFTGYVVFAIIDTIYYEPFSVYPSNIGFVYGLMIILYSLLFFLEIYEKGEVLYIERHPHFWINSAFMIYYSGTLILGLFVNYLMYRIPREKFLYLDEFFSAMTIVFNVLVCIGLSIEAYQNRKVKSEKSSLV